MPGIFVEEPPMFSSWSIEEGRTTATVVGCSCKETDRGDYSVKFEVKAHNGEGDPVKLVEYFRTRVNPELKLKPFILSELEGITLIIDIYNVRGSQGPVSRFEIIREDIRDHRRLLFRELSRLIN
mgnify:CR=1 FL=1